MKEHECKKALDSLIKKARVHLYKPIQIAEILYRDRVVGDISLADLESYRNPSKRWRDDVCVRLLGRISTSSQKFQDNLFEENAIPKTTLLSLGKINKEKKGLVETYIYQRFRERLAQMSNGLSYCRVHDRQSFLLTDFINLFRHEPGLRRSIDKVYEIVVYALFSALIEAIGIEIEVSMNPSRKEILNEFSSFAQLVINLSLEKTSFKVPARIYRVGVTNAADRGLDMFANFGLAIQIKHLSLSEELAEDIVHSVSADRIVIVCRESEKKVIVSLLTQIGWKARIQSVVTEKDLAKWYEKALRGTFSKAIGDLVLRNIEEEIIKEFPSTGNNELEAFMSERGYQETTDPTWI